MSPRNVTGIVNALVATGFVTREPHPTDRRATLVTPTEQGRRIAAALDRGRHELAVALFGATDPDRLAAYTQTLDEVLARFRELSRAAAAPPAPGRDRAAPPG